MKSKHSLIPRSLVNRPSSWRHYAIAAVRTSDGTPHTHRSFWCDIPDGFVMAFWELQPGRRAVCPRCLKRAQAIGQEDLQPVSEQRSPAEGRPE